MYITALWLQSPKTGAQGSNVLIYKHPKGLPHNGDLNAIIEDPGKLDDEIPYRELGGGENRVLAVLDLVMEDCVYDQKELLQELKKFCDNELEMYEGDPIPIQKTLSKGQVRGLFVAGFGPMAHSSTRNVFLELLCAIRKALMFNSEQIAA